MGLPVENTVIVLSQSPLALKASVMFPTASSMAETIPALQEDMSRDMRFPTMWHVDKCRLRRACVS